MPSSKRRLEKQRRIIEAAARVFARKGYSGTLMADIAVEAGVGKGTVYQYFSSKEDLFFEVFDWYVKKVGEAATVEISALSRTASEKIMTLGITVVQACVDMAEMYGLVIEFWAASATLRIKDRFQEAFRQGYAAYRDVVAALIVEGIERREFRGDIEPSAVAATLVGTWDALGLQAWFDKAFDPVAANENFMKVFVRGLKIDSLPSLP